VRAVTTRVDFAARFTRDFDRLERRFPRITDEIADLVAELQADERPGVKVPNIGHNVYKVRLANPSSGRGKSGGFRAIYYVQYRDLVILLRIYSKTDESDVTPEQIRRIIEEYDS
jgi:mRNA-degrading endonuclease RelE of RelBE toxin-antitoxin system